MSKLFMTIDFESIADNKWIAASFMIAEYPSGQIIETNEFGCYRHISEYSDKSIIFWHKNPKAWKYIKDKFAHHDRKIEEINMCLKINQILDTYPNIHLISDNPQFDIKMMDNILSEHGYEFTSSRKYNSYRQCLCTWSFQRAIAIQHGMTVHQLSRRYSQIQLSNELQIHTYYGHPHTPIYDCSKILINHFKLRKYLELIKK